jgi:pimeloyl-ACP methyl ester carboxylesterase
MQAPVLIVKGSASKGGVPPLEVAFLASSFKTPFRVDTVPGAGLYVQEEAPAAVVDAIDHVLAMRREELASPGGDAAVR